MEAAIKDIISVLEDKKACDLVILDVSAISTMTDFMVICTGTSRTHIQALFHALSLYAKEKELKVYSQEGIQESTWILYDLGFVVVHIMDELLRKFYNLERLWKEAKIVQFAQ
jgi:ribosome-associated protein